MPDPADGELRAGPVSQSTLGGLRADVCDPQFMISHGSDEDCASFGKWVGQPLFPQSAPTGLQGYCTYRYADGTPPPAQVSALKAAVEDVSPDCQVVMPQGNAITDIAADDLLEVFRWRIGWVDSAAMGAAFSSLNLRAPVTTAVIDTYPNIDPSTPPQSDHGPVVASVAESIACPGGLPWLCPVSAETFLGLPRIADGTKDTVRGGYLGRQSDLAVGIYNALAAQGPGRLVLNLSVGWDPTLFGGADPTTAPPPVTAVYDALRVARCEGALIIAAAGNTDHLICAEHPLAPGQWQDQLAPTGAECGALGLTSPMLDPGAPLVYAVGGLNQRQSVMPGTRRLGMPRLAAAATHVVAQQRAGMQGDAVKTGTSLSSAVASGAASLLWSFRPGLSPSAVMDLLYDNGFDVGEQSTFDPGGEDIRGVDVCAALTAACTGAPAGTACSGDVSLLACDPPFPVTIPDFVDSIAQAVEGDLHVQEFEPGHTVCEAVCGGLAPWVFDAPGLPRDCEEVELDPLRKFTEPQPPKNGCSDCVLTVGTTTDEATALLSLSDDFDPADLTSVDVRVTDVSGRETSFAITERELDGNGTEIVIPTRLGNEVVKGFSIPISLEGLEVVSAEVLMRFSSGEGTQDPMLVFP